MTYEIRFILEIRAALNNWYLEDDFIEVLGFKPT